MVKLSIVMPVYNAEDFLETTVRRFFEIDQWVFEIIIVDDASTDNTSKIIKKLSKDNSCIRSVDCKQNSGAGVARNLGFEKVTGEYVLFFDADDLIQVPALQNVVEYADATNADCVVTSYNHATDLNSKTRPMNRTNRKIWQRLLNKQNRAVLTKKQIGYVCASTNYPWNKLIRTSFAQRIGLKFGGTPVHNDILGSWYATMLADNIAITSEEICTHIVPAHGSNITNIKDERRMSVFEALDSVEQLFDQYPERRADYYHHFVVFKVRVLSWVKRNIPEKCRGDYKRKARKMFCNPSLSISEKTFFYIKILTG